MGGRDIDCGVVPWMIPRTNSCSPGHAWSRTCCTASPPATGAAPSTSPPWLHCRPAMSATICGSATATWCGACASTTIYNGRRRWNAAADVSELIASGGAALARYQPSQRYFLLDEGRVGDADLPGGNLVSALIALETSRDRERLPELLGSLIGLLREQGDEELTQAFRSWVAQVLLPRRFRGGESGWLPRLEEVRTMLAEQVRGARPVPWSRRARCRDPTRRSGTTRAPAPPAAARPWPRRRRRHGSATRPGRRTRVVFAVGLGRGAVEDEVGAVVHQRGVDRRRRARPRHRPPELSARAGDQHPHSERSFTIARVSRSMLAKVSMSARQPRRRTRA